MELVKYQSENVPARPLHVLVPLIKTDIANAVEAADSASQPFYQAAGEKLIEAEGQQSRTEFVAWAERNFKVGIKQMRRWMNFAGAANDPQGPKPKTLHQQRVNRGEKQTVYPKPWQEAVNEEVRKVDIEALKQDALKRKEERALQRKLALSLVDIGYKVLATRLHPDKKGGSREAMARLNKVRDILRNAVTA